MARSSQEASKARSRLGSPEMSVGVQAVKAMFMNRWPSHSLRSVPEPSNPSHYFFSHVVYLSLTYEERRMLEGVVGAVLGGDADYAALVEAGDEDDEADAAVDGPLAVDPIGRYRALMRFSKGYPREQLDRIAFLLFLRWSPAQLTIRNLLAELGEWVKDPATPGEMMKSFAVGLSTRHDPFLPWDSRKERATELLNSFTNREFWAAFSNQPKRMAKAAKEGEVGVMPAPRDVKIWRQLAYLVMRKHRTFRMWPGVHDAADYAAWYVGPRTAAEEPEYPFYDAWWQDLVKASAPTTNLGATPDGGHGDSVKEKKATKWLTGRLEMFGLWSESAQHDKNWAATMFGLCDLGDTWDSWILVRMIQSTLVWRENEVPAALLEQHHILTDEIPLPFTHPSTFVEIARYDSPAYRIKSVPDTEVELVRELVESVGLEHNDAWDLVYFEATRNVLFPHFSVPGEDRPHVFYLTEDVNKRYLAEGRQFPGQSLPCRCPRCAPNRYQGSAIGMWDSPSHVSNPKTVVFSRRKLQDTSFLSNPNRFWIDWNDCIFIMGRGEKDGHIIDGDTIYILETLPGIKARALKEARVDRNDERLGLASASLFFNLRLAHQGHWMDGNRNLLRDMMGSRYRPHYNDFAYVIPPSEFNFGKAVPLRHGSYGRTYSVPWGKARQYDLSGDIVYVNGSAIIKLVADFRQTDSPVNPAELFRTKFEAFYNAIAGNRFHNIVTFFGYTPVTVWYTDDDEPHLSKPNITAGTGLRSERVWAFVFEHATEGPLLAKIAELVKLSMPRMPVDETWYTLFKLLFEVGTAIRGVHVTGPHRAIHPLNILARNNPMHPRASVFKLPRTVDSLLDELPIAERYQAVLCEPSDVPSVHLTTPGGLYHHYLAPEIRFATAAATGGYDTSNHTTSTDAYGFARFVLDAIRVAGRKGLNDTYGAGGVVLFVEILALLEGILSWHDRAEHDEKVKEEATCDDNSKRDGHMGNDGQPHPVWQAICRRYMGLDREQAMDELVKIMRDVVTQQVYLVRSYLVPSDNIWYDMENTVPNVWSVLDEPMGGLNRSTVQLYSIYEQQVVGGRWPGDSSSDGDDDSEDHGLGDDSDHDDGEDVEDEGDHDRSEDDGDDSEDEDDDSGGGGGDDDGDEPVWREHVSSQGPQSEDHLLSGPLSLGSYHAVGDVDL